MKLNDHRPSAFFSPRRLVLQYCNSIDASTVFAFLHIRLYMGRANGIALHRIYSCVDNMRILSCLFRVLGSTFHPVRGIYT